MKPAVRIRFNICFNTPSSLHCRLPTHNTNLSLYFNMSKENLEVNDRVVILARVGKIMHKGFFIQIWRHSEEVWKSFSEKAFCLSWFPFLREWNLKPMASRRCEKGSYSYVLFFLRAVCEVANDFCVITNVLDSERYSFTGNIAWMWQNYVKRLERTSSLPSTLRNEVVVFPQDQTVSYRTRWLRETRRGVRSASSQCTAFLWSNQVTVIFLFCTMTV